MSCSKMRLALSAWSLKTSIDPLSIVWSASQERMKRVMCKRTALTTVTAVLSAFRCIWWAKLMAWWWLTILSASVALKEYKMSRTILPSNNLSIYCNYDCQEMLTSIGTWCGAPILHVESLLWAIKGRSEWNARTVIKRRVLNAMKPGILEGPVGVHPSSP